jgi:hypothetical protein
MQASSLSQILYRGIAIQRADPASSKRWAASVPDDSERQILIEADTAPELLAAIDEMLDRKAGGN